MDKKEFLEKRKALQKKIIEVQRKLKGLEQQYIDSSDLKRFKVGQMVKVLKGGESEVAFVKGWCINWGDGKVELELVKRKKDGTPSNNPLYYFPEYGDKVMSIYEDE